jgi:hypothetical protein
VSVMALLYVVIIHEDKVLAAIHRTYVSDSSTHHAGVKNSVG